MSKFWVNQISRNYFENDSNLKRFPAAILVKLWSISCSLHAKTFCFFFWFLSVLHVGEHGYYEGRRETGEEGWFPCSTVEEINLNSRRRRGKLTRISYLFFSISLFWNIHCLLIKVTSKEFVQCNKMKIQKKNPMKSFSDKLPLW